jgi:hypothetical protein
MSDSMLLTVEVVVLTSCEIDVLSCIYIRPITPNFLFIPMYVQSWSIEPHRMAQCSSFGHTLVFYASTNY